VQTLWIDVTAVGVGIPYDATAATLLAVFWACLPGHASLSQIVLSIVIAVPFGLLFRTLDHWSRRLNTKLIHTMDNVPDAKLPAALVLGTALGLGAIFLRYFLCYAVALWLGEKAWHWIDYQPRMTLVDRGLTMAAILLPAAGLGICLELMMSDEPQRRWDPRRILKNPFQKEGA
jgi:mannose/fructose/N-acetylgalactosamine-specific phosphotransferase system component IIC